MKILPHLFTVLLLAGTPASAADPPNIVFILADDMGYGDVSALNPDAKIRTPHLDQLARDGITFTDAHSGSAVCTPTRYGVLTGRYAWRSTLKKGVLGGDSPHLIPPTRTTVASFLKKQGYHTAMIGKWHLGWDFARDGRKIDFTAPVTNGPDINGFDHYYGHCGSLDMGPYVYVEDGRITGLPDRVTVGPDSMRMWRKSETGKDFVHLEVLPNFVDRGCAYIRERAATGEPFFLYLPLPAPHTPILPTKDFEGTSGLNIYGDFCLQVDFHVGQILAAIKESGVEEDTLVIFTADNGCSPKADFPALAAKGHDPSYKFRGHKADIYEGGHHVAYLARWPRKVKPGTTSADTVCLTDLLATASDITGVPLAPNEGEDSNSLLPALLGGKTDTNHRAAVVHHSIGGQFAIRKGDWKLILCHGSGGWSSPGEGEAIEQGLPPVQLYNLRKDPGEKNNVFAEHPDVVKGLYALLDTYVSRGRSTAGPPQANEGATPFTPRDWPAFAKEHDLLP